MVLPLSLIRRSASIRRALAPRWARLSWLVRGGLALCAAGAIADVLGHAGLAPAAGAHSATALQYAGHLVTMAGMVLILLEVIGAGLHSRPRGLVQRSAATDTIVPGRPLDT